MFKGNEIEASAIEAFTAKKKLEAQRQELKTFINFHYGPKSWTEILEMEANIRLQRKKEVYDRQQFIRKIWEYIGYFVLACTVIGFLFSLLGFTKRVEDDTEKTTKRSILNQYDLDGDNTITDEELQRQKK